MDIKDLNKSQLILLAILLSFITSIATGITTVTLMQQAPVAVTAPINRIIQQTVEKIVPVPGEKTVQTVVVKEEDLVVDALAKNKSSVFAVTKNFRNADGVLTETSVGHGFAVSTDGVVALDALWAPSPEDYFVENASGKFKANYLFSDKGVSFLKIGGPVSEGAVPVFTVPALGDASTVKVGQKILVLGGSIASYIFDGSEGVKVNVTKSLAGGLVLNLDGEALGMALSGESQSFASMTTIQESLKANSN